MERASTPQIHLMVRASLIFELLQMYVNRDASVTFHLPQGIYDFNIFFLNPLLFLTSLLLFCFAIVAQPVSIITPTIVTPITCATGLVRCCSPGPYQCGMRYPPIGGSPIPGPGQAPYGSYPWQAVMLGPGDVYQGSGVLIDPLNVLTVAHRTYNFT